MNWIVNLIQKLVRVFGDGTDTAPTNPAKHPLDELAQPLPHEGFQKANLTSLLVSKQLPAKQPALIEFANPDWIPWAKANEKFQRTKAWQVLREKVLERAEGKCEKHGHDMPTTVRWKEYPAPLENPQFKKPRLSDLWAVCGSCAKELSNPSDWSDPQHPWFPKEAVPNRSKISKPRPVTQLPLFGENSLGSAG